MPNAISTKQNIVRAPRLPNKRSNNAITNGYFSPIFHPSCTFLSHLGGFVN
jgi:hypothetical protein